MALGDIIFATIAHTASDPASGRKNYPIKRKYRQSQDTQRPSWPSSYTVLSTEKYWMPHLDVSVADFNYITYNDGDEYAWSASGGMSASGGNSASGIVRGPIQPAPAVSRKFSLYPANTRIVWAGAIYEVTQYMFDWAFTEFDGANNPYKTARVQKWKKLSDTSENWTQYWYHPLLRRFYVLAETDQLQDLPDFGEADQSRWDRFIGDAKDLNLQNFDLAQIRELISRGASQSTARATVNALTTQTTGTSTAATTESSVAPNYRPRTGTFSVPGISGTLDTGNRARMVQRAPNRGFDPRNLAYVYEFNLRPNNISYSNLGVTWTEIDRVNDYALVDYRSNKLARISFEFLVEANSGGKSSLYEDCETQLNQLQTMANRKEQVIFLNFDSLFGRAAPDDLTKRYRAWVIFDMSINSVQRVLESPSSSIARATVNMTIQEVQNTPDQVIFMPRLRKVPQTPRRKCTQNCGDTELCPRYFTDDTEAAQVAYSVCAKRQIAAGTFVPE